MAGRRHALVLTMGRADAHERDQSVSPLRYSGGGIGAGLSYLFQGASRTFVSLTAATSTLKRPSSVNGSARGDQVRARVDVTHVREIPRFARGNMRFFAGGTLDASLTARTQRFETGPSSDYLDGIVGIGPAFRVETRAPSLDGFAYDISVPLVTGLVRPYADVRQLLVSAARRPRWYGFGAARALRQDLTYTLSLSPRWAARANVRVDLFSYDVDPGLVGSRSLIAVGVLWRAGAAR